jgi:ParB family chromosome partitioning protein
VQRSIQISEITIPKGRRTPTHGRVASVARSIAEVGLLCPILVNEDYRLIAGLTRLLAVKSLGKKTIECIIFDADALHAELAEIDENIERSNLNSQEEITALKRRKAIYLELHPETAVGGDQTAKMAVCELDAAKGVAPSRTPSFVADTAEKTGRSERAIRRDVATAEALNPEAVEAIKDTLLADNKAELERLSKLPDREQVAVARKIKAGKAKSVKEATTKVADSPEKDCKNRVIPSRLQPIFDGASAMKGMLGRLTTIRKELDEIAKDSPWLQTTYKADLANVRHNIKFATPYMVCDSCEGEGCPRCRKSGWLPDLGSSTHGAKDAE